MHEEFDWKKLDDQELIIHNQYRYRKYGIVSLDGWGITLLS